MNQNKTEEICLVSDDEEEESSRRYYQNDEFESSFEWPEESKPESTKQMFEADERREQLARQYAFKRKAVSFVSVCILCLIFSFCVFIGSGSTSVEKEESKHYFTLRL